MITKLLVNGMSCGHCEHSIEDSLIGLEGINKVEAQYTNGFVEIDFEDTVITVEKIAAEIEALGYEVKYN